MKKLRLALIVALGIIGSAGVQALAVQSHEYDLYTADEGSVDVFGSWQSRNKDGGSSDTWGPGVGANYFFTQNIGAGVDLYTDGIRLPNLLNVSGIFRYPIPQIPPLAPYAFAGIGRQWWDAPQWMGHIGAGAEYRWTPHMGAFVDARAVFPASTRDYCVFRFGLRFKFR